MKIGGKTLIRTLSKTLVKVHIWKNVLHIFKSIDSYTNSGCTFGFEMCNQRNPNFKCATNEIVRSIKRKLKRMLNKLIFKISHFHIYVISELALTHMHEI